MLSRSRTERVYESYFFYREKLFLRALNDFLVLVFV